MNGRQLAPIVDTICQHVRGRTGDYYPALGRRPVQVRAVHVRRRQFAVLCELMVSSGSWRKTLLAKMTLDADQFDEPAQQPPLRSYFVSAPDPPGAELAALRSVHRHFDDLADPRYFTVAVLDALMDDRVIIVERVDAKSLNRQMWSASRTGFSTSKRQQFCESIHRAGGWLREFHTMPPPINADQERRERVVQQPAFLEWIKAAGARLAGCRRAARFFDQIQGRMISAAEAVLPQQLPMAFLHGDYAPRNVLVDQERRVAVIDILPEWIGCIWEDLAHFLMSVHTNKMQAYSCAAMFSSKCLAELDDALLTGYFQDDEIPRSAILLYEAQVALTKWAACLPPQSGRRGLRGLVTNARLELASRCYARYIEDRVKRIDQAGGRRVAVSATTAKPGEAGDVSNDGQLVEELRRRAPQYFPELSGDTVDVQRVSQQRRRFSLASVYRLRSKTGQREVFVKIPIASKALNADNRPGGLADRPRLVPLLPADQEAALEHQALARMTRHFDDAEADIGVVRLLDRLPESAIVVEALHCPTLEQRVQQANRHGWESLLPAFCNAGRWLRKFHAMPAVESSKCRFASTADVLAMVQSYRRYLTEWGVDSDWLNQVQSELSTGLEAEFHGTMPLACGHGDFGLHNIFVTEAQRAIGFDTPALWRSPPEEDLAYFLLLLETPPPWYRPRRLLRPSVVTTASCAFLEGYYGKPFSGGNALRWFEVLVALEKWVSCIHSSRKSRGLKRVAKRCRLILQQRQLQARIEGLMSCQDRAPTTNRTFCDALLPEPPTETVDAR